jgi:hypothetical protein
VEDHCRGDRFLRKVQTNSDRTEAWVPLKYRFFPRTTCSSFEARSSTFCGR